MTSLDYASASATSIDSRPPWGVRCLIYSYLCLTPLIAIEVVFHLRWISGGRHNTFIEIAQIVAFLGILPGIMAIIGRQLSTGIVACFLNFFFAYCVLPSFILACDYVRVLPAWSHL